MKTLKQLDLSAEEEQLRLVKNLRDSGSPRHDSELKKLHIMLAKKTLEYYCEDGYYAFFERYRVDRTTEDGYTVEVRGHDLKLRVATDTGSVSASGSTWDYIPDDLVYSPKPADMSKREYNAIKERMLQIRAEEQILYPFHSLHRIAHGYFDTKICLYGAVELLRGEQS